MFFYFFLFLSLSDHSHKAGAKNRQLPNERQLSGDQLQEGSGQCIRCNRPMSTVQHCFALSASLSGIIATSLTRQRERKEKKKKHMSLSFRLPDVVDIRVRAIPEIISFLRGPKELQQSVEKI